MNEMLFYVTLNYVMYEMSRCTMMCYIKMDEFATYMFSFCTLNDVNMHRIKSPSLSKILANWVEFLILNILRTLFYTRTSLTRADICYENHQSQDGVFPQQVLPFFLWVLFFVWTKNGILQNQGLILSFMS